MIREYLILIRKPHHSELLVRYSLFNFLCDPSDLAVELLRIFLLYSSGLFWLGFTIILMILCDSDAFCSNKGFDRDQVLVIACDNCYYIRPILKRKAGVNFEFVLVLWIRNFVGFVKYLVIINHNVGMFYEYIVIYNNRQR